jgi:hypothetical protein
MSVIRGHRTDLIAPSPGKSRERSIAADRSGYGEGLVRRKRRRINNMKNVQIKIEESPKQFIQKRPYVAPKLMRHGLIEELTQLVPNPGISGGPQED